MSADQAAPKRRGNYLRAVHLTPAELRGLDAMLTGYSDTPDGEWAARAHEQIRKALARATEGATP